MFFDALTMAAIAAEFRQTIHGGRVQRVVRSSPLSIGLEIYARQRRFQLLASAHPEHARVHLVEAKPTRDPQAHSPLLLHMKRRLRGASLQQVAAPPLERVLLLHFYHPKLPLDERENTLVIEIMGRHSNLILLDRESLVVDCIKRVTPQMSAARQMLPRQRYQPPPQQIKADPQSASPGGLERALAGLDPDTSLERALVNLYRGISPLLAREIVHRACGQAPCRLGDLPPLDRLANELAACWARPEDDAWEPCLALEEGRPVACAPYPLTHRPDWEIRRLPGISQALDLYYSSQQPLAEHQQTRQILREAIDRRQARLETRLASLEKELVKADQVENLRQKGEWLLAYQHLVSPGQTLLQVEGIEIELDPQHSPVENAQSFFSAYRKAKQAQRTLPQRIEETRQSQKWLEEIATLVDVAESFDEITSLATELEQAGILSPRRDTPRRKASLPPRTFHSQDGLTILVGRSARQNEALSLRRARPHDLWFHARGRPGAHVILVTEGRAVPATSIEEAAALAAYYSQSRGEQRVPVDYTECRNVRRTAPSRPGLVRYDHERTIYVTPARTRKDQDLK